MTVSGRPDLIATKLFEVHDLLEAAGIWHQVTYGTLLGAVRDGDVIPWDHDFDLVARPIDKDRIWALRPAMAEVGIDLRRRRYTGRMLAVADDIAEFEPGHFALWDERTIVGDIYLPALFADGVTRLYDFEHEVAWTPHTSTPHFFFLESSTVTIRGRELPGHAHPEEFLAGVYGDDWREPYRCVVDGGTARPDTTTHGDRYHPKLHAQIAWAESLGWDRTPYAGLPAWPRPVRGAGPVGSTERTRETSRALWWRDLDEMQANY